MLGIDKNNSEEYITDYFLDEENTVDGKSFDEAIDVEELIRKLVPDEDMTQERNNFAASQQLVKEKLEDIPVNSGSANEDVDMLTKEKAQLERENQELRRRLSESASKGSQLEREVQHLKESYEAKLRDVQAQATQSASAYPANDFDKQDIAEVMLEAKKMSRDVVASAENRAQNMLSDAEMEVSKKLAAAQEIISAAEMKANAMNSKAEREVAHKLEMGQNKLIRLKEATDAYMNGVADLRTNSERVFSELLQKCDSVIGDM